MLGARLDALERKIAEAIAKLTAHECENYDDEAEDALWQDLLPKEGG